MAYSLNLVSSLFGTLVASILPCETVVLLKAEVCGPVVPSLKALDWITEEGRCKDYYFLGRWNVCKSR